VRLDALGRAPRAELLHVLMLPEFDRADRIGEFWSYPQSRAFAERLIDCEEDWTLRAVLVGMLRETDPSLSARYKQLHPERAEFYASRGWRGRRAIWLTEHPDCAICGAKATVADHIVPLAEGGAFGGALQSLCKEHSRRKTLAESHRGMKRRAAKRQQAM
jgi:5-methylcytosine-specific restriction endonuclease McrA